MKFPLHIKHHYLNDDQETSLKRVQLHIHMSGLTRGKGFRVASPKSVPTRIERIGTRAFPNV
jgi:hypothetical protein